MASPSAACGPCRVPPSRGPGKSPPFDAGVEKLPDSACPAGLSVPYWPRLLPLLWYLTPHSTLFD